MTNSQKNLVTKSLYNKDYYENGIELGISGYKNYRWMPSVTIPFCYRIIQHCNISSSGTKILDYGAAKGYMVKAFRMLGYEAFGFDISEYAVKNSPEEVKPYMMNELSNIDIGFFDWIISKDVLEHVSYEDLDLVIKSMFKFGKNAFIIVPLGKDGKYNIPEYENDITHIIREPASWWIKKFEDNGFYLDEYSTVINGMKDNWSQYKNGNGFFVFRK